MKKHVIRYEVWPDDEVKLNTIRRALGIAMGLDVLVINDAMVVSYALGVAYDQLTRTKSPVIPLVDADPGVVVCCGFGSCQNVAVGWVVVGDERRSACRTHLDPALGARP